MRVLRPALLLFGLSCSGWWMFCRAEAELSWVPLQAVSASAPPHSLIARLAIPDLDISVPVYEGVTDEDLRRGAGRMAGSAVPGGLGNFVVAGHRDTVFRGLRRLKPGMTVIARTQAGTYRYRVVSTAVVNPDAVEELEVGKAPSLTLITCYPFEFVGAAPQRFVAHAELR